MSPEVSKEQLSKSQAYQAEGNSFNNLRKLAALENGGDVVADSIKSVEQKIDNLIKSMRPGGVDTTVINLQKLITPFSEKITWAYLNPPSSLKSDVESKRMNSDWSQVQNEYNYLKDPQKTEFAINFILDRSIEALQAKISSGEISPSSKAGKYNLGGYTYNLSDDFFKNLSALDRDPNTISKLDLKILKEISLKLPEFLKEEGITLGQFSGTQKEQSEPVGAFVEKSSKSSLASKKLTDSFERKAELFIEAFEKETGIKLIPGSGYRSPDKQRELCRQLKAIDPRKACATNSFHSTGEALDFSLRENPRLLANIETAKKIAEDLNIPYLLEVPPKYTNNCFHLGKH